MRIRTIGEVEHADNEVVKESEAEKAAAQITAKFHGLISKSIWGEHPKIG